MTGSNASRLAKVAPTESMQRQPRIALYSHDTQGLGHIRRNLLIAAALARTGANPTVLLISGLREAAAFASPPGVDCFTIPALRKDIEGNYHSRSLNLTTAEVIRMREAAIHSMLKSFEPDLFIADKVPLGAFNELKPSLQLLHERGTACVLGLREILDEPETVRKEWTQGEYDSAIRQFFDQIWVYGDQTVYDTAAEYSFAPDIAALVRYTGYLNIRDLTKSTLHSPAVMQTLDLVERSKMRMMLCVVGGGSDGLPLATAFMNAKLPDNSVGVLVTGPLMQAEDRALLQKLARQDQRKHLLEFVTDPCPLLEKCDRVIGMGGYNSVCEIMAYEKPALIVPRVKPRLEQLIRAQRLGERGVVDMLHPECLTPEALTAWLHEPAAACTLQRSLATIDRSGISRLPQLMHDVLACATDTEVIHAA